MGTVIKPTIGRVVLLVPNGDHRLSHLCCVEGEPFAATVAYVNPDDGRVNLSVSDHIGQHFALPGVPLIQADETEPAEGVAFCHWMPYQIGQAAKTEEAEAKAAAASKTKS